MTAFVVDDETIHEIVAGLVLHGIIEESSTQWAGETLRETNVSAVDPYHAGIVEVSPYRHRGIACTVGQVAKSVRCYVYQCDGAANWVGSDARRLCSALAVALLDAVPGYLEAEWR